MDTNQIEIKIISTLDRIFLANIIIFVIVWSFILNWYIAIGAAVALALVNWCLSKQNNNTIVIDKENDLFLFPAVYQYSFWKNTIRMFFPIFQNGSRTEIKLSELQKCSSYRNRRNFFIELYLPEHEILILKFSEEEDLQNLTRELRCAKPDLYWDTFHTEKIKHIRNSYLILAVLGALIFFDVVTPIDTISDKFTMMLLPNNITPRLRDINNNGWELDSVTDAIKIKNSYVVTAKFKKYDREEIVKVQTDGLNCKITGPDLKRFLILLSFEQGLSEQLSKKIILKKRFKLVDMHVVHVSGDEYLGIAKISINGKVSKIHFEVTGSDNNLSIKPIGSGALLLL